MQSSDEVAAVLAQVVPLGDDVTPQAEALGEAVARQIAQRPPRQQPDVRPYLAMATTVELLDELRRRVLNEGE